MLVVDGSNEAIKLGVPFDPDLLISVLYFCVVKDQLACLAHSLITNSEFAKLSFER